MCVYVIYVELAFFILLVVIASLGFIRRSVLFLGLGVALFFTLSIFFFAQEDLVWTTNVQVLAFSNATTTINNDNSTTTITLNNYNDSPEVTPIISSYHQEVAWLLVLFAFAELTLLVISFIWGVRYY